MRLASDDIVIQHGEIAVQLRPSLRAALRLERLHDGFAALHQHIADFHLGTIRQIIMTAATDRQEAVAFIGWLNDAPLKIAADTVVAPIFALVGNLVPASDDAETRPTGKPMPWPAVYRELYRIATGWLHWTPEAAWKATPTEINEAFAGHVEMLKAIHGTTEKDAGQQSNPNVYSPERLAEIDQVGHDSEFDRAGFMALKAKIASGR